MRTIRLLFAGHLLALIFGLGGLLLALPHPELWAGSRFGGDVYTFGINYGGSLHILLGAATMFTFGVLYLGWRRTLIFFFVTVTLALSSELIGTGTGWPFGNYAYNDGLGYKILGRVPFTIPLSWFYVGFSAFLLANTLSYAKLKRFRAVWSVAIGAYLLTVWDLVLDPAMAHDSMTIRFWTWSQHGPYFGMPIQNFVGWTLTGVIFIGISRALWRGAPEIREYPVRLPFGVYLANMVFAMVLSLSVGLWEPALAAVILGWIPAWLAWHVQPPRYPTAFDRGDTTNRHQPGPSEAVARSIVRGGARIVAGRRLAIEVQGAQNLPAAGPVLIACRHYHHLFDGCALIASIDRPVHILVALDWVKSRSMRRIMEAACRAVRWPVILRDDGLRRQTGQRAYQPQEVQRYLRQAVRESIELLRSGEVLLVYPEGYPNVDPNFTPKTDLDETLPFRAGFVRLVEMAQHAGAATIPIVPVGLAYSSAHPGRLTLRFGPPIYVGSSTDRDRVVRSVESSVHALSEPERVFETIVPREAVGH
ncbi:MAG TPA: carotenoid biosynthesis protein [Nitrolancea sp.]|nr:carotenoid biosynthesis protein [Nitrolancea sp.]